MLEKQNFKYDSDDDLQLIQLLEIKNQVGKILLQKLKSITLSF